MNFLAGWVDAEINGQIAKTVCDNMLAPAAHTERKPVTLTTPFITCMVDAMMVMQQDRCIVAVIGNAAIKPAQLEAIIHDYKKIGPSFIEKVKPPFGLLLADLDSGTLLLATDPIGQRHLYYAQTERGLAFASHASSIIAHPEVNSGLSLQGLYDYVYFHHCPSPTTIYKSVNKLEGGQILIYHASKTIIYNYWLPEFEETLAVPLPQVQTELRDKLQAAVTQFAGTADDTGAFLSGGLDSSSVAGALAQVFPEQAQAFTIGFNIKDYDETEYARIAASHFKLKAHEHYVTPEETVAAIPTIAAYCDEPFGNSSALAVYYCAKLAQSHGITTLLAGDGGDELFAGNERYTRQGLFHNYQNMPRLVRSSLEHMLIALPKPANGLLHKARRYVNQANTPLPDRLQDYNFLHQHPAQHMFSQHFLDAIDTNRPLQNLRNAYHKPIDASELNRMLVLDWKTTLHDNDLVKVNRMCELAGITVQYPLLDHDIVKLSCHIPSTMKLKGKQLRWFYKQAMQGLLPESILKKTKHGFGLPFGMWLQTHPPLKELAYESINQLKQRDYFQSQFLDHLLVMHQSVHAAYYGEFIWVLMMLELWLQGKNL
jgi:asparagine synthase (glutamine-hydrolysing)